MTRRACPPQGCDDSRCDACYWDALDEEFFRALMTVYDPQKDYPPPLQRPTGDST